MKPRFSGKVAIITGSSNGMGRATALIMAAEGAFVTIHGRSQQDLKKTEDLLVAEGIPRERICSVQGDVTVDQTLQDLVTKTFEKFKRIDILVNNAGLALNPKLDAKSMEFYDQITSANVKSMLKLTTLAEPYLEKTKGSIVVTSSITSILPRPHMLYYAMSKSSTDHFVRCRTHELAKKGIRINSVNPGITDSNLFNRAGMTEKEKEEYIKKKTEAIPLARAAKPEEIAKAICFLASDDASYITGASLPIDGGAAQYAQL